MDAPPSSELEQVDSRRLTGPNLLWSRPGAVLDVRLFPEGQPLTPGSARRIEPAVAAWRVEARRILDAVGWHNEELAWRQFPDGASLALSAPVDVLYAATEVNEWAWRAALRRQNADAPSLGEVGAAAAELRRTIDAERKPALLRLRAATLRRDLRFTSDDDLVSVGSGAGSRTFPTSDLPEPGDVPWHEVHDVPVALVTGTNGKTTTVRLLAAIARAAGLAAGFSSTEGVQIGEELVERGDYSGPGGARKVLRDRRVELAVLETARGGMLRRGLVTDRAEVGVVTNVAADHLGELGIADVTALAEVKLMLRRVARVLVLGADDDALVAAAGRLVPPEVPVVWFGLEPDRGVVHGARCRGDAALLLEGNELVRYRGPALDSDGRRVPWGRVVLARSEELPLALGGAARHNFANALAAAAAAAQLGLDDTAIHAALASFGSDPRHNPGRLDRHDVGGVTVLVDFAHNPHGLDALLATARALSPRRLLLVLGQAGDRDDEAIRDLARTASRYTPDRFVLKALRDYQRGRADGEVESILEQELLRLGAPPDSIVRVAGEVEALRSALAWAEPGDVVLQLVHSHREQVLEQLRLWQS
ncbi:MAG TPA: Mur ligase family protein [Thermoanaerobaculia bacterium]|nr:Mur ligase family protein [Thermoanaerobaculia bacterium]